jgi:tetratricopeptide (TPR) repeat protein
VLEPLPAAERLLTLGRLDRAEQVYRAVLDADPRNSIAVTGLARVALERGDDEQALALSRRALEVDPENVAAQRLIARLEEVHVARGSAAPAATPPTRRGVLDRLRGRR